MVCMLCLSMSNNTNTPQEGGVGCFLDGKKGTVVHMM